MTSEVYVWAWTPGRTDPTAAGVLVPSGEDMHFAYAQSYLKRSDAVPLSPTLPLTDKWFRDAQDMNMPSALRDAAPDAWGRRVVLDRLTGVRGRDADVTPYTRAHIYWNRDQTGSERSISSAALTCTFPVKITRPWTTCIEQRNSSTRGNHSLMRWRAPWYMERPSAARDRRR